MFEKELNQMENSFRDTDLIVVIDKNGKILYYNNFNDKINKYKNADTIGKYIWEIYPWVKNKVSPIFKVMETGEPLVNQFHNMQLDNSKIFSMVNSAFPLKTQDGIMGAIGISVSSSQYKGQSKTQNSSKMNNFTAQYTFDNIITTDPELKSIIDNLSKASKSNSNVFIYGETGTGKELFAHSIHNKSPRKNYPFIAQNCAAIPESLMESIFFGTTKGSFTGSENKKGLFEMCNGGTVFLDEINSMPLELQVKILRVLEEKAVCRIGDNKFIPVDIRIIAATNEKPEELLEKKKLRMDLFFRLNVIHVEIPPLRMRKKDISVLCVYFIHQYNFIFDKNIKGIDHDVMDVFLKYHWPGNVRELKNTIESVFNIVDKNTITLENIPKHILDWLSKQRKDLNMNDSLSDMVESFEKNMIEKSLAHCKYNIVKTAKLLKIPRQTLYYKLKKYNLIS